MKRFLSLLAILALLAGLLSACQKTPERPVVVQKDMEQLIEMAMATPAPTPEAIGGASARTAPFCTA